MNLWTKLRILRILILTTLNPNRTDLILDGISIAAKSPEQPALKNIVRRAMGFEDFKKMYEENYMPHPPALDELAKLPENTFGHALYKHMNDNKLDFSIFPQSNSRIPIEYISHRLYQDHDLWHVILGRSIEIEDELAIQGFGVAQYHSPIGTLLIAGGILHLLSKDPTRAVQGIFKVNEGFQIGRKAKFFLSIKLHELFEKPLSEVREICGVA